MDVEQNDEVSDFPVRANNEQSLKALNGDEDKDGKYKSMMNNSSCKYILLVL